MKNKLLLLILKEKIIVFTSLLLAFGLFLVYSIYFYVPLFSTQSKLFVRNIEKQDIITPYDGGSIIKSESGYSNPLFNLIYIIQSQEVASKVYDKTKNKYSDDYNKFGVKNKESWYKLYGKLVKANIEPSTDIIKVSFNWNNKKNAGEILGSVINEFKKTNLLISKSAETKRCEYLDKQVNIIGHQLDSVREKVKNYKLKSKAIDIINETSELTRAKVDLVKQAEILKSDIYYQNKKLRNLASQLGFSDAKTALRATAIGQDPYLINLTQDLASSEQNYAKLSAKFTDSYPDVIAAKEEIITISNNIQNRQKESLSSVHVTRGLYDRPSQDIATDMSRAEAEKSSLISKLGSLERGINELKSQENTLPQKLLGLQELEKQEEALSTAFTNAKQKQMESRIKENEIVDNIFLLDKNTPPVFLLNIILVKFLGFMTFGLFIGVGMAWIKEDMDDKWCNSAEIEEITGQNILGVLPWIKEKTGIPINFLHRSNSIMGVAVNNIASNIASKSFINKIRVISFISTTSSRRNSSVVPEISISLARSDRPVVLIDTDFSHPSKLLKNIKIEQNTNTNDIIDVINEANKFIRSSEFTEIDSEGLFEVIAKSLEKSVIPISIKTDCGEIIVFNYLCATKKIENVHNYVATRGFRAIVEYLRTKNEFVLIDTPPKSLIYPEFSSIISISDAVTIISAMETGKEALIKIVDKLLRRNAKILGIIPREANTEIEKHFLNNFSQTDSNMVQIKA